MFFVFIFQNYLFVNGNEMVELKKINIFSNKIIYFHLYLLGSYYLIYYYYYYYYFIYAYENDSKLYLIAFAGGS